MEETLNKENNKTSKKEVTKSELTSPKTVGIVNAFFLNMRIRPNLESDVIKIIKRDEKVQILVNDKKSDFYKIKVGEDEGYCIKSFIDIEEN